MILKNMLLCSAGTLVLFVIAAGCMTAGTHTTAPAAEPDTESWSLTLNGTGEKQISMTDLRKYPAVTGYGYAVSTTGIRFGPYDCTGVDIRELVTGIGGMGPDDQLWVSAPDGYLWVFDYDQLWGEGFITFDENLKEIPSPALRILLVYEQDGKPVTYNDGGPARIAIVSEKPGIITEGSAWVKWVNRIEIHRK